MSVGDAGFHVKLAARGWLGKWLRFDGVVEDLRPPIGWDEVLEMLGLYLLEKEEQEEARNKDKGE